MGRFGSPARDGLVGGASGAMRSGGAKRPTEGTVWNQFRCVVRLVRYPVSTCDPLLTEQVPKTDRSVPIKCGWYYPKRLIEKKGYSCYQYPVLMMGVSNAFFQSPFGVLFCFNCLVRRCRGESGDHCRQSRPVGSEDAGLHQRISSTFLACVHGPARIQNAGRNVPSRTHAQTVLLQEIPQFADALFRLLSWRLRHPRHHGHQELGPAGLAWLYPAASQKCGASVLADQSKWEAEHENHRDPVGRGIRAEGRSIFLKETEGRSRRGRSCLPLPSIVADDAQPDNQRAIAIANALPIGFCSTGHKP